MALLSRVEHESGLVRAWFYDDEADTEWFAELWPHGAMSLAEDLTSHAEQALEEVELGINALEATDG